MNILETTYERGMTMAVTKRTRFEVLRRDNYTCRYCHATNKELTIDHVIPQALGGTDDPDNLVACCRDCNNGKTSINPDEPLVEDVKNDAIAFRNALREAVAAMASSLEEETAYVDHVIELWGDITDLGDDYCLPYPKTWDDAARYWYRISVPESILEYAFGIVSRKCRAKTLKPAIAFNYASGIIGNKMKDAMHIAMDDSSTSPEPRRCGHCFACVRNNGDCALYSGEHGKCKVCGRYDCMYALGYFEGNMIGFQEGCYYTERTSNED